MNAPNFPSIRLSAAPKPAPVVVQTVCSLCGLAWALHGEKPTTEDCIRLLKAELASRPYTGPTPWVVPYVQPYVAPWWDYSRITCGSGTTTDRIVFNTAGTSAICPSPISA